MASTESNIDPNMLAGIYQFKIHGAILHRVSNLNAPYGSNPSYAQLYFYDVDQAVNYQLRQPANSKCCGNLMKSLTNHLRVINPFMKSFKTMQELYNTVDTEDIQMYIVSDPNTDLRRFNDATRTDVAVIFKSSNGAPPIQNDMIVFSKTSTTTRHVSYLNSSLDPLAYPILFPFGDHGWHKNIKQANNNIRNYCNISVIDLHIVQMNFHFFIVPKNYFCNGLLTDMCV